MFSNYHLAALVLGVPYVVKRILPLVNRGGFYTYWSLVVLLGAPITIGYWMLISHIGGRVNERVPLPGKDIEEYIDIHDEELQRKERDPHTNFHDAYFDGKIDFKGDVLDIMELRRDWVNFHFTPELFKYVLFDLIPEVVVHSAAQEEEQVRDHYDRGDDFYNL